MTKRQLRKRQKLISKIEKLVKKENNNTIDNVKNSFDENTLDENIDSEINEEYPSGFLKENNEVKEEDVKSNNQENNKGIKNHVLYLKNDDLIDLYLHSTVGTDERIYLSHDLLDKYQISNPDVEFVNVNGVNIPVEKFGDIAFKDPQYVLENHDIPKDDEEKLEL